MSQLFEDMRAGKLGDIDNLSFPVLTTAYKRRLLLDGPRCAYCATFAAPTKRTPMTDHTVPPATGTVCRCSRVWGAAPSALLFTLLITAAMAEDPEKRQEGIKVMEALESLISRNNVNRRARRVILGAVAKAVSHVPLRARALSRCVVC